jgi:hypothetical protein
MTTPEETQPPAPPEPTAPPEPLPPIELPIDQVARARHDERRKKDPKLPKWEALTDAQVLAAIEAERTDPTPVGQLVPKPKRARKPKA